MFGIIGKTAAVLGLALAVWFAGDRPSHAAAGVEMATFAATGPETSVPFGWLDFCERHSGECVDADVAAQDIDLTPAAMKKIQQINLQVNSSIEAVTDMDHWGVVDRWDYPVDGKGDCEDFALLKRRMLIAAGFPRQALLLTVVKEANGDGHAVLTLKTSHGEFVLDNLNDAVKPWNATGYRFVKRQSQENENVWVAIGAPTAAPLYVSKK